MEDGYIEDFQIQANKEANEESAFNSGRNARPGDIGWRTKDVIPYFYLEVLKARNVLT